MSRLSRFLHPSSPESRRHRALRDLAKGEYNKARLETEGLADPESHALYTHALAAMVVLNLEEFQARRSAGEPEEAASALARARQFGATEEQIRAARQVGRARP